MLSIFSLFFSLIITGSHWYLICVDALTELQIFNQLVYPAIKGDGIPRSDSDTTHLTISNGVPTWMRLDNPSLSGTIPTEIGLMTSLQNLDILLLPSLSGTIPTEIGMMSSLKQVIFSGNPSLSGTLPTEIGMLETLRVWQLFNSPSLSGTIPTEMATPSLATFLSDCSLSGTIPTEIGATSLNFLKLFDLPSLSGTLPIELRYLPLYTLDVHNCSLSGVIPWFLGGGLSTCNLKEPGDGNNFVCPKYLPYECITRYVCEAPTHFDEDLNKEASSCFNLIGKNGAIGSFEWCECCSVGLGYRCTQEEFCGREDRCKGNATWCNGISSGTDESYIDKTVTEEGLSCLRMIGNSSTIGSVEWCDCCSIGLGYRCTQEEFCMREDRCKGNSKWCAGFSISLHSGDNESVQSTSMINTGTSGASSTAAPGTTAEPSIPIEIKEELSLVYTVMAALGVVLVGLIICAACLCSMIFKRIRSVDNKYTRLSTDVAQSSQSRQHRPRSRQSPRSPRPFEPMFSAPPPRAPPSLSHTALTSTSSQSSGRSKKKHRKPTIPNNEYGQLSLASAHYAEAPRQHLTADQTYEQHINAVQTYEQHPTAHEIYQLFLDGRHDDVALLLAGDLPDSELRAFASLLAAHLNQPVHPDELQEDVQRGNVFKQTAVGHYQRIQSPLHAQAYGETTLYRKMPDNAYVQLKLRPASRPSAPNRAQLWQHYQDLKLVDLARALTGNAEGRREFRTMIQAATRNPLSLQDVEAEARANRLYQTIIAGGQAKFERVGVESVQQAAVGAAPNLYLSLPKQHYQPIALPAADGEQVVDMELEQPYTSSSQPRLFQRTIRRNSHAFDELRTQADVNAARKVGAPIYVRAGGAGQQSFRRVNLAANSGQYGEVPGRAATRGHVAKIGVKALAVLDE